ncbi:MAG: hypothetical protein AB7H71_05660 [Alphaproteobacteria bacterium]
MTIWMRTRRHDPTAGLGDLETALAGDDCPVCARAAGADGRWLDRFLDDGYLERDVMRRVAAGGGFCAFHTSRLTAIGQSATVAIIYLSLIEDLLPRLAARRDRRGRHVPLLAAPDACEACAHQREVERRECFFLALLIRARGLRCYGAPALVCLRHLPPLLGQLDERDIAGMLALHRAATATLAPENDPDSAIRRLLGPLSLPRDPAAPPPDPDNADTPDPVRRMRRRLRELPSCAICAEIADASAEWLAWLARASENAVDADGLSDVLPLCRDHVRQARTVAGPTLAPALAAAVRREAEQRLAFAGDAAAGYGGSRRLLDRLGRAFGAAPARSAVLASLRRGRECPLCARIGEAGERALALLAALVEDADGRHAFESGYGLCVRHAALALAMPHSPALSDIVARTTRARLLPLRWELEEQLRRGAWQARPQRRGVESAAWLRAGPRFAGTV